MVERVRSGSLDGIDGCGVVVEIDAGRGLPSFQIVGLPNAAVRESRERVMAAVRNSGFAWPTGRVVVSLLPADLRKEGASLDLAIAAGICALDERSPAGGPWRRAALLGELSLSGALRPVRGLLAMVQNAADEGCTSCVVPRDQQDEAALVPGLDIVGARDLCEAVAWRRDGTIPAGPRPRPPSLSPDAAAPSLRAAVLATLPPDQRRLAEAAAAGRHNLLLYGPPGSGKTRLARLVADLQPPLRPDEMMAVARIHSAAGLDLGGLRRLKRPFRAPHHTVTRAGLVGGGGTPRAGEATLAHRGVLFLDEIAEFRAEVLDVLREPLESGRLLLSRANGHSTWPADFQLLAAMNPCRCGLRGSRRGVCRCTDAEVARYQGRLSGPLLDRFDIFAEIEEREDWMLSSAGDATVHESEWVGSRERIAAARNALDAEDGMASGRSVRPDLSVARTWPDAAGLAHLEAARGRLGLSIRGVLRCLLVARTLARLDGGTVTRRHVGEALALRGATFRGR